jgi:hypothetical protein
VNKGKNEIFSQKSKQMFDFAEHMCYTGGESSEKLRI